MTARIRHIAILAVFLSPFIFHLSPLSAQSYIGPTLSGNFVQTIDHMRQTHSRLGGGGGIGIAYEWQREHLLLRTGVEYALQCPSLAVDSQWLALDMIDTRGVLMTYRGLLTQRTDHMTMHQVTAPMMVGGIWRGAYVLVGAKIAVSLANTAHIRAQLKTAGDYQGRYYEWFENMPNHGYHDLEPVTSKHSLQLKRLDVRLAAEVGYTFHLNPYSGLKLSPLLRVGLFAEYGLINILSSDNTTPRTSADWSQYLHVDMTHIYASQESTGMRANLLTYGLRLTLLFPVSNGQKQSEKCYCIEVW